MNTDTDRYAKPAAPVNVWQQAIDAELVNAYLGVAPNDATFEGAQKAIHELICWHIDVATNPATNGGQRLTDAKPTTGELVMDVRCEGCGYMTHHREHMGCVRAAKQHTHPAPSAPAQPQADALDTERLDWLVGEGNAVVQEGIVGFWVCWLDGENSARDEYQLGEYPTAREAIDAAIAAAKENK
jgi:hypothetical protein